MTRMDLISPRTRKDGKTYWHKIGAAFPLDNGGYQLVFDSLPLTDAEGRCAVLMKEAKPRDTQEEYREKQTRGPMADQYDGGDSIPF